MGNSPSYPSSGGGGGSVSVGRGERGGGAGGGGVVSSRIRGAYGGNVRTLSGGVGTSSGDDRMPQQSSVDPHWLDSYLPEPEKFRDFQGGPKPQVVPPLVPIEHSVYNLMDEDAEETCPTCLEPYTEDNPKITAECGHAFHLSCILEWLNRSESCPFFCPGKMKCKELDLN